MRKLNTNVVLRDLEETITRIQDIGQNHVPALGVQTNGSTALPRPTCWPRRQKQYLRTHFLHELLNWDTSNEDEMYVPPLLVELLKRRDEEVAGVASLAYHDEQLPLQTLEETLRAKIRQAESRRPTMVHGGARAFWEDCVGILAARDERHPLALTRAELGALAAQIERL